MGIRDTIDAASAELAILHTPRAGCGGTTQTPAEPRSRRGRWRALVLLLVHAAIAVHIGLWLAGRRTLAPLEPSEAGLIWTDGAINAGLVFLVLLVASTLIFGRFFCGWACHVVALQDASAWLLGKLKVRPKPVRSRLLMLVPFLAAFEIFLAPGLVRWLRGEGMPELSWQLTTTDLWARFPGPWMALLTFLAVGFFAVWLLGQKGFCTYGCPYGALFGVADRFARGRIRVSDACEGCGHCTAVCTSNVLVHKEVREHGMVVDPGCMKCMDCVSACPKGALSFAFGPLPKKESKRAASARRFDFVWQEEVALALLFVVGLYAFRGLYGAVPFLLAVTLAVLFAFLTVSFVRFVRRRDFRLQHGMLRRAGRVTATGGFAGLGMLLFAGFTLHSTFVQWHLRTGLAAIEEAGAEPDAARRAELLRRGTRGLALARDHGLAVPLDLERRLGAAHFHLGDGAAAAVHFARATQRTPDDPFVWLELYRAHVATESFAKAAAAYDAALNAEERGGAPLTPERAVQLAPEVVELVRRAPEAVEPTLLFARLQAAAGDRETAVQNLRSLQQRHPGDTRIAERLASLGAP